MSHDQPASEDRSSELSPATRKRLSKLYQYACRALATGNFKGAVVSLFDCVTTDPSSAEFIKQYWQTLCKQLGGNRPGAWASPRTAGRRTAIKACVLKKDWRGLFEPALELLKINPWDIPTLLELAAACEHLHLDDAELTWLSLALEVDKRDAKVNRRAAGALERRHRYDDAIRCWQRVQQAQPDSEEARRKVQELSVARTIERGGLDSAAQRGDSATQPSRPQRQNKQRTEEQTTRESPGSPDELAMQAIAEDPSDPGNYLRLAESYLAQHQIEKAAQILDQGLAATKHAPALQLRREDVQIAEHQLRCDAAKRRWKEDATDEAKSELAQAQQALLETEISVYRNRCRRQSDDAHLAAELGCRLEQRRLFEDAVMSYQRALNLDAEPGPILMALGRCFQSLNVYGLASRHFMEASHAITERDSDLKKEALYRTATLALEMGDRDTAGSYLSDLASIDYHYKNVAELVHEFEVDTVS